jgi:choline dehydrogenase
LDQGQATGVEFEKDGQLLDVQAAREVIVSTGAIKTPQLLMLSGIGPSQHLKEIGVSINHHLPGVGQNLQDHLSVPSVYECTKPVTFDYAANPFYKLMLGTRWFITRSGLAASNIWEAGGYIRGNQDVDYPNLQYHFAPIHTEYEGTRIKLFPAFTAQLDQLRPRSKGCIKLISANPKDRPAAFFNYLSDHFDLVEMVQAIKAARDLVSQPAFDEFRGKQLMPGPDVTTDREIESWVRANATTDYHPSCTCRMGSDEMAVVDEELSVHGLERLRIVDASVMPDVVSGNLNAPTQMIALRASDFIRGREQLPSFHANFNFN